MRLRFLSSPRAMGVVGAGVAVAGWTVDRTGSYTTAFVTTALVMASGAVVYLRYGSGRAIRLSNGS